MNQPETTVKSFILAHSEWNRRSNDRCKKLRPGSIEGQRAIETAKTEYHEIIKRLGSKLAVPQPISFGDDPMHDPDSETIESVAVNDHTATVRTNNKGMFGFVSTYEYRLVKESSEWRISSLLYIDEDGSYECL